MNGVGEGGGRMGKVACHVVGLYGTVFVQLCVNPVFLHCETGYMVVIPVLAHSTDCFTSVKQDAQ